MMSEYYRFAVGEGESSPGLRLVCPASVAFDYKKQLARRLAGVGGEEPTSAEGGYFARVFEVEEG